MGLKMGHKALHINISYRLKHTTQLGIDWTNGISLHYNAILNQDWRGTELAKEKVLLHQLGTLNNRLDGIPQK